jgi:hypothetical protein
MAVVDQARVPNSLLPINAEVIDGYSQLLFFPNRPNREKISTHKFDVGVFTQSGPNAAVAIGFAPQQDAFSHCVSI